MNTEFLSKLRCPACGRALTKRQEDLICTACGSRYGNYNGIPLLLDKRYLDVESVDPDVTVNRTNHLNWKRMQVQYHEMENADFSAREFELRRPWGESRLFERMGLFDLQQAIRLLPSLHDKTLMSFCCGRGMDAEFFARAGAKSIGGLDIVPTSVEMTAERLARLGVTFNGVCCDAENVPLSDASFDFCMVYDGLHHLPNPYAAVDEMIRVARLGVVIIEPNASPLIWLSKKIGFTTEVEASGNYKHYFDSRTLIERL